MARPTPRLHLYSQGIVAENSWTLIDPGSMTRIWLVMKSDRLLFFTKPSMDHKPLFTVRLEEILSVHDHMTTIVCIETAERKYYLQRSGVPDGQEEQQNLIRALRLWQQKPGGVMIKPEHPSMVLTTPASSLLPPTFYTGTGPKETKENI